MAKVEGADTFFPFSGDVNFRMVITITVISGYNGGPSSPPPYRVSNRSSDITITRIDGETTFDFTNSSWANLGVVNIAAYYFNAFESVVLKSFELL